MNTQANIPKLANRAAEATANRLQRDPVPTAMFAAFAASLDTVSITLSLWFARFVVGGASFEPLHALFSSLAMALFATFILLATASYRFETLQKFALGTLQVWCAAYAVVLLVTLAGAPQTMSVPLFSSAILLATTLAVSRIITSLVTTWARDFGLTARNAVILGGGAYAEALIETIDSDPSANINILGMFDDRSDDRSPDTVLGIPKLGRMSDVIFFVQRSKVDMVVIAFPEHAKSRIAHVTELLRVLPVDIHLCGLTENFGQGAPTNADETISIGRTLRRRPFTRNEALAKRVLDVIVASGALVVFSPFLALIALAIKLDSKGPVLFSQDRSGFNGSVVPVLKFRSMYAHEADQKAQRVVTKDDPRVTKVGRILRRTSLDELPQLINVLRGDISLVGPRPHAVNAVYSETTPFEELVDSYAMRHRVQPGMTGWAQINGWRGEIDSPERLEQRVKHDLFYIENRSLWLDVQIMLKTVPALLNTEYAY